MVKDFDKKLMSAFEQVVSYVRGNSQVQTMSQDQSTPQPTPRPEHVRGKTLGSPQPIRSNADGTIQMSDGSVLPGVNKNAHEEAMKREEVLLGILMKNIIDQTPFTKQALAQLKNVTLNSVPNTYGGRAAGFATVGKAYIDPKLLNQRTTTPYTVGLHEIVHATDKNVSRQNKMSGATDISDSRGFYNKMTKNSPAKNMTDNILGEFKDLYDKNNPITRDVEGFAYTGQQGANVYLNESPEVSSAYEQVFVPMSKNINYSPTFPAPRDY